MNETHDYHTSVTWNGQRKGLLSCEGLPSIEVATPPEFPKGHPGIWSPEHLFVASAEICLMTTFLAIAENTKLEFEKYHSTASGILEKTDEGYMMTKISLFPTISVADASLVDRAKRIIEKAEKYCLISNSMRTEVLLFPTIEVI